MKKERVDEFWVKCEEFKIQIRILLLIPKGNSVHNNIQPTKDLKKKKKK